MEKWKVVESSLVAANNWGRFYIERCITEGGFEISNYFKCIGPDYCVIFAVTDEGKVILVEQYRHGANEIMLELPAGRLAIGESPENTAKRELLEETGFEAGDSVIENIFYPSPPFMTSKVHVVFVRNATKKTDQSLKDSENINIVTVVFDEILNMINHGKIKDSNMVAAALLAIQKRGWFLEK